MIPYVSAFPLAQFAAEPKPVAKLTLGIFLLCILCQAFLVLGQILLKHAMNGTEQALPARKRQHWRIFALSIASLTVYFFLWVGLLGEYELSFLYPFEGMQPLLIVLAAALFLGERLHWRAWIGITLISAGIILVSGS